MEEKNSDLGEFLRQADGSYKIVSKYDEGKALDVNDASNYSGSNVQAYRDNNSDAQRWFIYSAGKWLLLSETKMLGFSSAGFVQSRNIQWNQYSDLDDKSDRSTEMETRESSDRIYDSV